MTVLLLSSTMSQRGGYQQDPWGRQGAPRHPSSPFQRSDYNSLPRRFTLRDYTSQCRPARRLTVVQCHSSGHNNTPDSSATRRSTGTLHGTRCKVRLNPADQCQCAPPLIIQKYTVSTSTSVPGCTAQFICVSPVSFPGDTCFPWSSKFLLPQIGSLGVPFGPVSCIFWAATEHRPGRHDSNGPCQYCEAKQETNGRRY